MTAPSQRMTVTILGSGTCVPSLRRSACAVLMEYNFNRILIDVGPGTTRRLLEAGVAVFDISHLLISHFHPDHTGELVPFLFANKYPAPSRRRLPLQLIGGPGFKRFFQGLKSVFGQWIDPGDELLQISELNGFQPFSTGDVHIETAPVNHRPESLAYRLNLPDGHSMVYSGDTDASEDLTQLATQTDLLICESAFPDQYKSPGHLTPFEAGTIAQRAGVAKLVLTHLYPECDQVDIATQCRKAYNGPIVVAEDLMRIAID